MKFAFTHPMHSPPYNPELAGGAGVAAVAVAAEAAGFAGFGFTDHPAPTQKWLDAGGHDALDPFVAMGFAAAHTTTLRLIPNVVVLPYRNPFVVAKAGAEITAKGIAQALEQRLAKFKQPKQVFVVADLPRNTMGKVQKNLLREQYKDIYARR